MKRMFATLSAASFLLGAMVGIGAAAASAACNGNPNAGVYFYKHANCGTLMESRGAGFTQINSFEPYGGNNEMSSVNLSKANSTGSMRVRLYDGINRNGQLVGLTNADTSGGKSWNLSNLNVNDMTNSSCSDRVSGSWDPELCSTTG